MFPNSLLQILDARSFGSAWFWLVLAVVWSFGGRRLLGIPADILMDAGRSLRRAPGLETPQVLALLDWMSLNVPRWRVSPRMGLALAAALPFGLSVLAGLGFAGGLEMAQALSLLLIPQAVLLGLRLRLAGQLHWILRAAELGQPAPRAATDAMQRINRYRIAQTLISLVAVIFTGLWAMRWILLHPYGV